MRRLDEAVNLAASGELEEARSAFEDILLDEPRNAEALYNLGMCFTELGWPDKAVKSLEQTVEFLPRIPVLCLGH